MASMNSSPWSPIDSELLFPSPTSDRNELFIVDEKTDSHYPDQEDQPVKSTYCISKDAMRNQGPHRAVPGLAQSMGEIISEISPPLLISDETVPGRVDFEDEFTDDEFYPGGCVLPARVH